MSNSRTRNSVYTAFTGLILQVFTVILGFITRTIFIKILGSEYLGINGLFTNILSLISLAELGMGSAIIYYMYKPLADDDKEKLKVIMNFYRKCYRIIGIIIFIIGLSIMPFIPRIVKLNLDLNENLYIIYLLFLLNSVVSYLFFAYRNTIIFASQKGYVLNKINTIFVILSSIIEICMLVFFENFTVTLLSKVILSVVKNIVLSIEAGKLFPFINEKSNLKLDKHEVKIIMKNVYSIFVFRLSSRLFESTDNIIISAFVGTVYVGYNSNYLMIITSALGILNIIRGSFVASVGNVNAVEDSEKKYLIFKNLDFLNFWMSSFYAVCFFQLLNPFIELWIGKEYLFSTATVGVIVGNFFTVSLLNIIFMYRETMGLFRYGRYTQLVGAIVNIFLSIFLAKYYGVFGVFLSTLICGIFITILPYPKIIYKYGFNKPYKEYILKYFGYIVLTLISCSIVAISCSIFSRLTWLTFIAQMLLCILIPNSFYIIIFRKTKEYLWIKKKVISIFRGLV